LCVPVVISGDTSSRIDIKGIDVLGVDEILPRAPAALTHAAFVPPPDIAGTMPDVYDARLPDAQTMRTGVRVPELHHHHWPG
jgi:hypothetical protein